jgi:ABC-type antimicrobial peptide transport system permease subunit
MKKLIIILSIVVGLALIIFFVAGYFLGNVPVASAILGTNKPKDLGVKISVDNATKGLTDLKCPSSAKDVAAIVKDPKSYTTGVKTTLTSDEASSLLALGNIQDLPFKETQIKFGPNGDAQCSGVLDVDALQKYLKDNGVSGDTINTVMSYAKNAKYLNFYVDAKCSIVNNNVTGQINSIQLGKIDIPSNVIQQNKGAVASFASNALRSQGYNIRRLTISEGKVDIDMDRPLSSAQSWLKLVHY